jgi:hypothetical protein
LAGADLILFFIIVTGEAFAETSYSLAQRFADLRQPGRPENQQDY